MASRSLSLRTAVAGVFLCASFAAAESFVDDAGRTVALPDEVARVFAAGFPAEVLLYTLAPEKLAGRNHLPSPEAQAYMPPELRTPTPITVLPSAFDARNDADLLALEPDVFIDYGDLHEDYVRNVAAVQQRTWIASIILDGRLGGIPEVYRRLGGALGVAARGNALAAATDALLARYAGALRSQSVRVYVACSRDGGVPCLEGDAGGEVAAWLGAVNVAGTTEDAAMRMITVADMAAWDPDVIVGSPEFVAAIQADDAWAGIRAVAAGRVHAFPTLPFNWGSRPPSVNRLLGLPWLARVLLDRDFDAAFLAELRQLFQTYYHISPTDEQLRALVD